MRYIHTLDRTQCHWSSFASWRRWRLASLPWRRWRWRRIRRWCIRNVDFGICHWCCLFSAFRKHKSPTKTSIAYRLHKQKQSTKKQQQNTNSNYQTQSTTCTLYRLHVCCWVCSLKKKESKTQRKHTSHQQIKNCKSRRDANISLFEFVPSRRVRACKQQFKQETIFLL